MSAADDVVVVVVDRRMSRRKQDLRPLDLEPAAPAKKRKGKGRKINILRRKKAKRDLTEAEKLIKIAKKMGRPMDVKLTEPKVTVKEEVEEVDEDCYEYEYLDETDLSHLPIVVKTETLADNFVSGKQDIPMSEEYLDEEIILPVEKHEINMPKENLEEKVLPVGKKENYMPEEYLDEEVLKYEYGKGVHRYTMVKANERHSYVEDLRKERPELRDNEKALIEELKRLLNEQTKPQPVPENVLGICEDTSYYLCNICGDRKQTHIAAIRHYQEKHGPRYLHCFACGVDFRSLTNLYKHEKRCAAPDARLVLKARAHVVERRSNNRPFAMPKKKKCQIYVNKKFPCSVCGAEYSCKVSLQAHEAAHRGVRPYACAHCHKRYTSRSAQRKHSLTHFEKRFECDHCGAKFYNKPALASHMGKHMGTSRVTCAECGKQYCSADRLRLHTDIVHLKRAPHLPCQLCDRRYRRTYDLKRHMLRAHQMKVITKKMYFQNLPSLSNTTVTAALVTTDETSLNEEPTASVKSVKIEGTKKAKNKKEDIRTYLRTTGIEELENDSSQDGEPEIITGDIVDNEEVVNDYEDSENSQDSQNSDVAKYLEVSHNSEDSQNETMQGEYVDENNCEVIEDSEKLNDILKESDKYQVYVIEKGKMTKKLNLNDIKDQLLEDYKIKGK